MTSGETFFSASEILKLGKIPFVVVSRHLHLCMSILGLDITPLIFIPTSQQPTHTSFLFYNGHFMLPLHFSSGKYDSDAFY